MARMARCWLAWLAWLAGSHSIQIRIKRLVTKKDLSPSQIDRAVVDSNRSVNLPFDMRKILCIYPRKRKDIRGLQMFQIGDLSSFLAGGLTCIRCGDLFVSWSGFSKALVEKTRIHEAFWWTILFQSSSILEAKARIVVWHWTKSLLTKRG